MDICIFLGAGYKIYDKACVLEPSIHIQQALSIYHLPGHILARLGQRWARMVPLLRRAYSLAGENI